MLPFFILLLISELNLNSIIATTYVYGVLGLIGVSIYYVIGSTIAKHFPRKYSTLSLRDMFLISFQILSTAALLVIAHYTGSIQLSFTANILILLLQFSFLASSVLAFFIYSKILDDYAAKEANRQLLNQIDYYKYQFEQIKASQTVIGRIEHDIEKHLLALKLDLKNAQASEAEQKIDALIGNLHLAGGVADSGNPDVDAILNYKAKQAMEHGIRVECGLRLPYTLNMNTTDLAVILGNALDNAIEACKTVEPAERAISVALTYEQSHLQMTFSNPFAGSVITDAAGELVTTKQEGAHGIGLKSIKDTVDKYNGVIDVAAEHGRFVLKILLFNLSTQ